MHVVSGAFLNDTKFPINFNYVNPSVSLTINGRIDLASQRFEASSGPLTTSNRAKLMLWWLDTGYMYALPGPSPCDSAFRPQVSIICLWSFVLECSIKVSITGTQRSVSRIHSIVDSIVLDIAWLVSNGNCASTCAQFTTLMNERHNTTIAVFGGRPGQNMEFKGSRNRSPSSNC